MNYWTTHMTQSVTIKHGTLGGYTNHRCRCVDCTLANSIRQALYRPRIRAAGLPDNDPRHGTNNGYTNYGCRCDDCTAANTAAGRAWRGRAL